MRQVFKTRILCPDRAGESEDIMFNVNDRVTITEEGKYKGWVGKIKTVLGNLDNEMVYLVAFDNFINRTKNAYMYKDSDLNRL